MPARSRWIPLARCFICGPGSFSGFARRFFQCSGEPGEKRIWPYSPPQLRHDQTLWFRKPERYTKKILAQKRPQDILAVHFLEYQQEILDKAYHQLKISDSVYKYRSKILQTVKRWKSDPATISVLAQSALDEELFTGSHAEARNDILTKPGEMKSRRRLYEDKVTGKTRFLLDERLGLEKRDRVSAGVKELAVRLSTEMSFRQAADVLAEMTPGVSPMTAWNIVKEAGEEARLEGQRLRERVFERGENPGGSSAGVLDVHIGLYLIRVVIDLRVRNRAGSLRFRRGYHQIENGFELPVIR